MRIRPTTPGSATFLNIAEMSLYDAAGAPIAPLAATLSTTYNNGPGSYSPAENCIDGNTTSICSSYDPGAGDSSPTLTVRYNCSGGSSTAAKVVVHNRPDCCQDRLTLFTLDFLNASQQMDASSFQFIGARGTYTVLGSGAHLPGELIGSARSVFLLDLKGLNDCCSMKIQYETFRQLYSIWQAA